MWSRVNPAYFLRSHKGWPGSECVSPLIRRKWTALLQLQPYLPISHGCLIKSPFHCQHELWFHFTCVQNDNHGSFTDCNLIAQFTYRIVSHRYKGTWFAVHQGLSPWHFPACCSHCAMQWMSTAARFHANRGRVSS